MPDIRGRFSVEELKQIGWRVKSVRSLTGLNQEEFSLKSDIPYMTLKGWELGRALPRQDGARRILQALEEFGVHITLDWIIFGQGNGPIYGTKLIEQKAQEDQNLKLTIEAFKSEQRKKGNNPIVVEIKDSFMSPRYNVGDLVGGVIIALSRLRKYSSAQIGLNQWLVHTDKWIVRDLLFNGDKVYMKQAHHPDIEEVASASVGKIIWHYFADDEQT